ncbi:hypothetical protein V8C34DRAFT_170687 [Trichoderma compactum]
MSLTRKKRDRRSFYIWTCLLSPAANMPAVSVFCKGYPRQKLPQIKLPHWILMACALFGLRCSGAID